MTPHEVGVGIELGLAAITAVVLLVISAPYGRHSRGGWGPTVPNLAGWLIMEVPAVVWITVVFAFGSNRLQLVPLLMLGLWQLHYVYRTFVYPFRLDHGDKRMPLVVAVLGAAFHGLNGWVNGYWLGELSRYDIGWLTDPRFLVGIGLFVAGMGINRHADAVLRGLRAPGSTGYAIPHGGLYRWVSCPNYLGEVLMWFGWAVLTWSTAGLAFALYTAANLVPRALTNHRWYHDQFEDYPTQRRAILPFVL